MAIAVKINAAFNVDNNLYTANIAIPAGAPTGTAPFLFSITSTSIPTTPPTTPPPTTNLVTVAVGAASEVFVAVAPPVDLINSAAGSTMVQTLDVVVSEGTYDPTTQKFTTPTT